MQLQGVVTNHLHKSCVNPLSLKLWCNTTEMAKFIRLTSRWLKAVSCTIQDLDFDVSLRPPLINAPVMVSKYCPTTSSVHGVQSHLKFPKFKAAVNLTHRINSVIAKDSTMPLKLCKLLKLKLRVSLVGHSMAIYGNLPCHENNTNRFSSDGAIF